MAEQRVCPIHYIVSDNHPGSRGIGVVYEKKDGKAGYHSLFTRTDEKVWELIRFIDDGPAVIIFEEKKAPRFSGKDLAWTPVEIRLRRATITAK